jgi:hypothetical protein
MQLKGGKLLGRTSGRQFQRLIISASLLLTLVLAPLSQLAIPTVNAAWPESVRDTLSSSQKGQNSRHTIIIDQTAGTAFEDGETIEITFPAQFTVPSFTPSDATFNDGTARTLLASCSAGSDNISLGVSGQVVTFTACASYTAETAGNPITIVLGTGSTLATNPANSGIYYMDTNGTYGDDQRGIALAITEGVTLSLTIPSPTGNVRFTGDAFPSAFITILDGGAVVGTTTANSTSFFDKTITGLSPTVHTFSIFAQAADGRKTITLSFDVNVISGSTVTVSGILLPPIITVPTQEKRPVPFPQSGLARHSSTVNTFTAGNTSRNGSAASKTNGTWSLKVPQVLHLGAHTVAGLVNDGFGNQSVLTTPQNFTILLSADLSIDNLVNLTDFSILMFNYGTSNPPNDAADINDNGPVDLVDFSVMMFYWTGG